MEGRVGLTWLAKQKQRERRAGVFAHNYGATLRMVQERFPEALVSIPRHL